MAARVRGALVVDVPDLAAAARALAGALESGGLGPRYRVRLDGGVVFFNGRPRGFTASAGRLEVHTDGRVSFELAVGWAELARVVQAVGLATAASLTSAIALGWMFHQALPLGALVGVAWTAASVTRDRRRLRSRVRAMVRSLFRA